MVSYCAIFEYFTALPIDRTIHKLVILRQYELSCRYARKIIQNLAIVRNHRLRPIPLLF